MLYAYKFITGASLWPQKITMSCSLECIVQGHVPGKNETKNLGGWDMFTGLLKRFLKKTAFMATCTGFMLVITTGAVQAAELPGAGGDGCRRAWPGY